MDASEHIRRVGEIEACSQTFATWVEVIGVAMAASTAAIQPIAPAAIPSTTS